MLRSSDWMAVGGWLAARAVDVLPSLADDGVEDGNLIYRKGIHLRSGSGLSRRANQGYAGEVENRPRIGHEFRS